MICFYFYQMKLTASRSALVIIVSFILNFLPATYRDASACARFVLVQLPRRHRQNHLTCEWQFSWYWEIFNRTARLATPPENLLATNLVPSTSRAHCPFRPVRLVTNTGRKLDSRAWALPILPQ